MPFSGDDLRIIGVVGKSSASPIGYRCTVGPHLKFFTDALPIFSIVEPSTGNLVMPARTSWTSAGHRSMDCRLGALPSQLWNWSMSPIIVGIISDDVLWNRPMDVRWSADCRPITKGRPPADYKESADFKGHRSTPARRPADVRLICTRLAADWCRRTSD